MIAVNALRSACERRIVGETNELDDDVLLVAEVLVCLPYLLDEILVDDDRIRIEMQ